MATVQLQVSPGVTISADTTKVDAALLNMLARPVVTIPDGAGIGPVHLDMAAILDAAGDALRGVNYIARPNFWPGDWQDPAGIEVEAGATTENPVDWYLKPVGGSALFQRVQDAPNGRSSYAAEIVGSDANTLTTLLGWIPAAIAGSLRVEPELTFSIYVKNLTSATAWFTPVARTALSLDDRDNSEEISRGDAQSVEPGEWGRITLTFSPGDAPEFLHGAWCGIETANLDGDLKAIYAAQAQLEIGGLATDFIRPVLPAVQVDLGEPPKLEGNERAGGARLVANLNGGGNRRTVCEPPAGFIKPVLTWNRGGWPEWIDLGSELLVFSYTGSIQYVTVPDGINTMAAKCWGAGGSNDVQVRGGVGGYSWGTFTVTAGDTLAVIVGEGAQNLARRAFGFGGAGQGAAHQHNGGGLSGIFDGGTPVSAADSARAILIAGGGGAAGSNNGRTGLNGGNGNDPTTSGGMPTMQGTDATGGVNSGDGGGGGGYAGGQPGAGLAGFGGTGFLLGGTLNGTTGTGGGLLGNTWPSGVIAGVGEPEYEEPAAQANRPGLVTIEWSIV